MLESRYLCLTESTGEVSLARVNRSNALAQLLRLSILSYNRYTSYNLKWLYYLNVAPLQETFVLAILGIAELVAKHKCVSYICA